jgi:hypothetical protein
MMIVAVGSGCSTCLMSTHLTDEAAICDTIVVLDKGSVCFVGSPDALARVATGRTLVQADAAPTWARAFWRPADGRYRILGTNWHLLVLSSWSPRSRTGISRSWGLCRSRRWSSIAPQCCWRPFRSQRRRASNRAGAALCSRWFLRTLRLFLEWLSLRSLLHEGFDQLVTDL